MTEKSEERNLLCRCLEKEIASEADRRIGMEILRNGRGKKHGGNVRGLEIMMGMRGRTIFAGEFRGKEITQEKFGEKTVNSGGDMLGDWKFRWESARNEDFCSKVTRKGNYKGKV
jgi:hypothetical protein